MRYTAVFLVSASTSVEVEADSREEAETKAWEAVRNPRLCHHCSRQVDIGDVYELSDLDVERGEPT